jgi:hypothetical protein
MNSENSFGDRFNEPRRTMPHDYCAYSDAEVAELLKQLGIDPITGPFAPSPIAYWRNVIDQAATFCKNSDYGKMPNGQDKHLERVATHARALLRTLGDGLSTHMIDVEPPGLRRTLANLADKCDEARKRIAPAVDHTKKQRKKTTLGRDVAIAYLVPDRKLAFPPGIAIHEA